MKDEDIIPGLIAALPLVILLALVFPQALLLLGVIVLWAAWVNAVFYIVKRLRKRRSSCATGEHSGGSHG